MTTCSIETFAGEVSLTDLERRQDRAPVPSSWDYAPARRTSSRSRSATASTSAVSSSSRSRRVLPDHQPGIRGGARGGRPGRSRGRRPRRAGRPRRLRQRLVDNLAGRAGEVPLPDRAHPAGALTRVRGAGVAERREADQGVSRRRPSAGGRTLLLLRRLGRQARVRVPAPPPAFVEWPARSSRGTSRCSCSRGRSRRRWPPETRSSSSPPRRPRSRRCCSPTCCARPLPPGVVNIVTGDGRAGAELVKHPDVDKIAFTGSTEVGKAIQRELAGTGKRLTLELGGKAANIIFDDAALDQAVEGIVNGIYFNQATSAARARASSSRSRSTSR